MYTARVSIAGVNVLAVGAAGIVSSVVLGWPYLADAWRRLLAVLMSIAGLAFLLAAVNTEGQRESTTVTDFLLGSPPLLLSTAASASLPYYLLTAVCLFLGVTGLAVGERAAGLLRRHYLSSAVGVSIAVVLLRFGFEKAAAPPGLTRLFGLAWLAPIVGAFFYLNLRGTPRVFGAVTRHLAAYALATRTFVVVLYALASVLRLGSHFDVTPLVRINWPVHAEFMSGSLDQFVQLVIVAQLTFWFLYTLAVGLVGALLAHLLAPLLDRRGTPLRRHAEAPALEDEDEDAQLAAPTGRIKA